MFIRRLLIAVAAAVVFAATAVAQDKSIRGGVNHFDARLRSVRPPPAAV